MTASSRKSFTPHVGPAGKKKPSFTHTSENGYSLSCPYSLLREKPPGLLIQHFLLQTDAEFHGCRIFTGQTCSNMSLVWFILFLDGSCVWIIISDVIMCGWTLIWKQTEVWYVACSWATRSALTLKKCRSLEVILELQSNAKQAQVLPYSNTEKLSLFTYPYMFQWLLLDIYIYIFFFFCQYITRIVFVNIIIIIIINNFYTLLY